MSAAEVLRQNLLLDTTTISASTVTNLYPTLFSGSAAVPPYINTCLVDLLGLIGGSAILATHIISTQGEQKTRTDAQIIIQPTDQVEPYEAPQGIDIDTQGGETAYIDILVKNVKDTGSVALVKNVGLRIRMLLDYNLRGSSTLYYLTPDLQVLNEPSVQKGYFKCEWVRSTLLTATEQAHRFRCSYVRVFI